VVKAFVCPTKYFQKETKAISFRICSERRRIMEIIRTKRLLLRDFEEADWKATHSYGSDPEVVRYMDWGPNTEEETEQFIQQIIAQKKEQPRRNYTLAIVLKLENKLIGGCGISVSSPDNREGWIGYCLNHNFWGQGYATETAKALLKFGFNQLNLHRMFATCDPANTASAHVLEKIGMHNEGHLREHKWAKGKWRDSLLYAILDYEWKQLASANTK
jgi:RimJ/RimL family protein N-acetyltransferase